MFVHPAQVQQVVRRFPEITRARLVVTNPDLKDEMTLQCETAGAVPDGLGEQVAVALKEITKLRGSVAFVPAGTLPNDGKVIDDQRQYE